MTNYSTSTIGANNIVGFMPTMERRLIQEKNCVWREHVKRRLDELCALPNGWDGYKAGPVLFSNAQFALSMLDAFIFEDAPIPDIVPGFEGDLQIEWHLDRGDIELQVTRPYEVFGWKFLSENCVEESLELRSEFSRVYDWLKNLVETNNRHENAAA